ncbi:rnhA operon protein [Halorutilales archaeon Cl-col2-1]
MTDDSHSRKGKDRDGSEGEDEEESEREDWVDEAVRLTKMSLTSPSPVYEDRLDELAAENGFVARLRDDETLVLYPDDWVVDGEVDVERIEDTDRAHEIPLSEKGESWEDVHSYNSDVIEELSEMEEVTETEVSNAEYFVEFLENHYILPVDEVSQKHVREFLEDYYPRNVWSSPNEEETVKKSVRKLLEAAGLSPDETEEYLRDSEPES